jgi:hypothetical protein
MPKIIWGAARNSAVGLDASAPLGCALVGYHFQMAALNPKTGAIDRATLPLYGIADPVLSAWVIGPILTFIGWLMTLIWFWRRKSQTVPP